MKIIDVTSLAIADVKVITYKRFSDSRGYFTEIYRKSDFAEDSRTSFLRSIDFTQANESYSKKGTVRGLHFQWDPLMAKFVRVLSGSVIDLALDIRHESPTYGKIVGQKLSTENHEDTGQWVWIPVGFAHGLVFEEEATIEYFCTGQWSPQTEAGISPLAPDINWSLCNADIKKTYDSIISNDFLISDKDRAAYTLSDWGKKTESQKFRYIYDKEKK